MPGGAPDPSTGLIPPCASLIPPGLARTRGTRDPGAPDRAWPRCAAAVRHRGLAALAARCGLRAWRSDGGRRPQGGVAPARDGDPCRWDLRAGTPLATVRAATPTDPIIGVDVGASTISAGLVSAGGTVLATAQAPTRGEGDRRATILALIDRVLARAAERGLRAGGIGVGLPGLVDVEKGCMRSTPASLLSELGDVPLASLIHERTGLAVFVDNDVNALTLGEWMFGLGRGVSSLVTVAIGTGMGGGLILDGTLVRGHLNTAGEIGTWRWASPAPRASAGASGAWGRTWRAS